MGGKRMVGVACRLVAAAAALSLALTGSALAATPTAGRDGDRSTGVAEVERNGGHRGTVEALRTLVRQGVPGATAEVREGRRVRTVTVGVGNLRTAEPRSTRDRYRVGSITKTFVATVLSQLEAEGRLSLDDTVDRWLPGVVQGNGHDGSGITVRALLDHTSGVYDYTSDEEFARAHLLEDGFLRHRYDTLPPERLVAVAMGHEPLFAPGTSWGYSNTNYILAGMVIEEVTGASYADEIRRRVIDPLDLEATSVPGTRVTMPRPSGRAYSKLDPTGTGRTHDVTRLNPSIAGAAGEMISSSADLNRFYSALLGGRILPAEQLARMKSVIEVRDGLGYGLGLTRTELSCGVVVWGHGGGVHGSVSQAVTTEDGKHSLAYNLNSDWVGDGQGVVEAEFCRG
ncbi:serine hydrolase domain-containing protein [Streptomyces sp. WMMC905]|uniref:serine hydrolase domain-containing protein n=1 Tax=Streptomyces sp. WMMC905 TaxID=3404123 RepID=UPI003B9549A8